MMFFFFKQKTAYELRISDWSSDVCSSDLSAELRAMTNIASNGYQSGFGNEFATEAVPGALPQGRNSPQKVAHGLYAEQLSGTAFTAPRGQNRRSWLYRIRPAAMHGTFEPFEQPRRSEEHTSELQSLMR